MFGELALGSLVLIACVLIHTLAIILGLNPIRTFSRRTPHPRLRLLITLTMALAVIIFVHTTSVWLWAGSFIYQKTFDETETALYFALATYTTVGYGDIILGEGVRIFATMAGVTGLLNFGLSTAFLIDVMGRFIPLPSGREDHH